MYFQVAEPDGFFVLDPSYENDVGSYETHDDTIKVLVTNKRDIVKFCKECFVDFDYEWNRKLGPFNQYHIDLKGPILKYSLISVIQSHPPFNEAVVFSLKVNVIEITQRDYRSPLLSQWVLGLEHPTQFNKILKRDFNVEEVARDIVKITRKKVVNPKDQL